VTVILHVTNGDSVVHSLVHVEPRGDVVAWRDALHEGPLPTGTPAAVRRVRARFLAEAGFGAAALIEADLAARDAALARGLDEAEEVVLWFEHDLYDQLQLVEILARAAPHPRRAVLRLICIDRHPAHPRFTGLGELSVAELAALWPGRRPLSGAAFEAASAADAALRAPDPRELARRAAHSDEELPFLAPALLRLLEELPSASDGLARSEWQVLRAIEAGAATPATVFHDAQRMEEAPFLGDSWCFRRLQELAAGPTPLVETTGGGHVPAPPPLGDEAAFRAARLGLTAAGRSVLDGAGDRVALVPLDRWLGGTHLTAPAPWRIDAERGELVAP
jgi:hypothetical protein